MQKETGLTRQQIRALDVLMATGRHREAADAAGVTRTTLYRWMKDPAFLEDVKKAKPSDEIYRKAFGLLTSCL